MTVAIAKDVQAIFAVLMWVLSATADVEIPVGGVTTVSSGVLDLACTDLIVAGRLEVGSGAVNNVRHVLILPGGVIDGGSGAIRVGGDWTNDGSFVAGTSSVIFGDGCGVDPAAVNGSTAFFNLTFTSTTGKTWVIEPGTAQQVRGTYTAQGTPTAPIQLTNGGGLTPAYIYTSGPRVVDYVTTSMIGPFPPVPVPTLTEWMVVVLGMLVGVIGLRRVRRVE